MRDKRNMEGQTLEELDSRFDSRLFRPRDSSERLESWRSQLEELKEEFPGIDIEKCLGAPQLRGLLKAGVDFKTAFAAANMDEIRGSVELEAEKRAVERVLRNSERAVENGVAASKSAPFTSGGERLTKSERDEIVKRVRRGEEIRL